MVQEKDLIEQYQRASSQRDSERLMNRLLDGCDCGVYNRAICDQDLALIDIIA